MGLPINVISNAASSKFAYLTVGTSFPSSPIPFQLFFNTTNNKLFRYSVSDWHELDWRELVKASPEWQANRLRIHTGNQLQISNDGTTWNNCIPAVGADCIEFSNPDNTSYSRLLFLLPGQRVIFRNANHVPVVFSQAIRTSFNMSFLGTTSYETWVGLRPNNTAISNGDGQWLAGGGSTAYAGRSTGQSIVPVVEQSAAAAAENRFFGIVKISGNRMLTNGAGLGFSTYETVNVLGSGTVAATAFWLGTWFRQDGVQFSVEACQIERGF